MYSTQFQDVYFSKEGGLAETRHVFLAGNDLPRAWKGRPHFTICETGFGTGLNFLAAWALFEETTAPGQTLDYISFEKYPLSPAEIRSALSPWSGEWGCRLNSLLQSYPIRVPGFHRIILNERVRLTLIFDDVNKAVPQLTVPDGVNAWFLDGFSPAKNSDMWTEKLFRQMARLSANQATVGTFTAAGIVRNGLKEAGFHVEKKQGFGRKRDMTYARYERSGQTTVQKTTDKNNLARIAIIGGGLAGTSCAYVLNQQGCSPVLFEKAGHLAAGASGNVRGLYNPRFSALRTPESDFYTAAFAQALRMLNNVQQEMDIGFEPCGTLYLLYNDEKARQLRSAVKHWQWHKDHMQILEASAAAAKAGVAIQDESLFLPDSGSVSPQALCRAYAAGVEQRLNTTVNKLQRTETGWRVNEEDFDTVILAGGAAVTAFPLMQWLTLQSVRGQISLAEPTAETQNLSCNICYNGFVTPAQNDLHMVGATFQKEQTDIKLRPEDHEDNLTRLRENLPGWDGMAITDGRAGVRMSAPDHFPVVGPVPDQASWKRNEDKNHKELYVTTAHGAYGIVSSLAAAHLLCDMITGKPCSLSSDTTVLLSPDRFLRRARKRNATGKRA